MPTSVLVHDNRTVFQFDEGCYCFAPLETMICSSPKKMVQGDNGSVGGDVGIAPYGI